MKFIKSSLFILTLFLSTLSFAQIGNIQFEKTTHDFGNVTEESKQVSYEFNFTNSGDADLKVLKVKTSCGCTASQYTKEPIPPGKSGVIKVTYTTIGRPGTFRKSITVTINNPDKPNVVLFIKGFVTPKKQYKGDVYPITMGGLKLVSNHLAFNELKSTEIKKDSIKIFNAWGHPMEISFKDVPEHIQVQAVPSELGIDDEGYIIVTYDGSKKKDFGLVYDRISIQTNDNVQPIKTLNVSARLIQDFSQMTEKEMAKAPKMVLKQTTYNFGTVKSGSVITYQFEFKNEGKRPLEILQVKSSCGCTTTKLEPTTYKKNKSGVIEVQFDTAGRKGKQHKTITIITNDPNNSQITLSVTGDLD